MSIKRKRCVICNHDKLKTIYKFDLFPVYMGVSDNDNINNDKFADMKWGICKKCGCVQLKTLIDLDLLYHKGHNSAHGKTWEEHNKRFSDLVIKYCGHNILEIGGGNLKLANLVTDKVNEVIFTVVDSNCEESNKQSIITQTEFFDYNHATKYKLDTIVHSHVLEHFYEPIKNIQVFEQILKNGQRMIMSVPLLDIMVAHNFTNSINFEHTYMIGEEFLDFIISITGFKVIHKEVFNPYNIFVVCEKTHDVSKTILKNSYKRNLDLFNTFIKFHKDFVNKANEIECDGVYVFGGHIFSQYLFMFGLDANKCIYVLDNDPNKIGRRLYGTNMLVESPNILSNVNKPVVILRAAQFSDEIEKDILTNINSKTIIIK